MSEEDVNNVGASIVDVATNYATGGIVGYDRERGTLRAGSTPQIIDEGIGEVTGRNMMREEMARAQARLLDEQAAREQELQDEQTRDMQQDITASRMSARRAPASSRGRAALTLNEPDEDEDYLGL